MLPGACALLDLLLLHACDDALNRNAFILENVGTCFRSIRSAPVDPISPGEFLGIFDNGFLDSSKCRFELNLLRALALFIRIPSRDMCTILLQTFDNQAGISLQGKRALRNAEADAKTANVDLMRVLNNQSTSDITLQSTLMRLNRTEAIVQRLQNRHARYRFRLLTEIAHQTGYVVVRGKDNRIELR